MSGITGNRCVFAPGGACRAVVSGLAAFWLLAGVGSDAGAQAQNEVRAERQNEVIATVGDSVITLREYAMTLRSEVRRRFYHAKPPEAELAAFHREVADRMIDRRLALQEAKRQGLRVDAKAIDAELKALREKNGGHREKIVDERAFWTAMRNQLEEEQLLARFRGQLRQRIDVTDDTVRRYYDANPDKFTEPERVKVAVILLKVQASSPQLAWDGAREEAERIVERVRAGGNFAELAKLHSADSSAARGGDLGYLHKGMLGTTVETVLDKLKPGQVSEPVTILEGVALFRLLDRTASHLSEYQKVRERARELLLKEEESRAWTAAIAKLREKTPIRLEEKYLMPG